MIRTATRRVDEGVREIPQKVSPEDSSLKEFLEKVKARIVIMGVGGGGSNTITRLNAIGIDSVETVAVNTDAQHLLITTADRKLLIGRELCGGNGSGGDPHIGEEAARENADEIEEFLSGSDLLFIMAGLGGGTGTGASPVIAEIGKRVGAAVVSVVTLPFTAEGAKKREIAMKGLAKLASVSDTIVVVNNDKILEIAKELPLYQAFFISDEIVARAVKGVVELVMKPGLVNVDLADLRNVIESGGPAVLTFGESDGENRAMEAVDDALGNPLLDADISGGKAAIVNITSGPDFSLEEMQQIVETIVSSLDPNANVIWGARIDESLKGSVQVLLVVTGVASPTVEAALQGELREPFVERATRPKVEKAVKALPRVTERKTIPIAREVRERSDLGIDEL
ncbi:cell division protein FtsZ [Candidatus Korarchaeum cryptofilum]|jgi:cell division protein FtsZ|uniref:Cell division protein FtsZ n=1 Tax=Candidatus Korarchaeum cryptofilum TaxID=498846 RepID=A0A429G3Q3_9CREN|nr:cell division protein FtsZ [Candidatus Korarchaeum cryptofilum]RSN68442.1 cell division protein FtsZ [Candidatus Korarchaeum cryptofilum]